MHSSFVILAAGKGERFGDIPKQYYEISNGKTVLETLLGNLDTTLFNHIILVVNADHHAFFDPILSKHSYLETVYGGKTRQESVVNALGYLRQYTNTDIVFIHDGARPFINNDLILKLKEKLKPGSGVIPTVEEVNTLKEVANNIIIKTIDRKKTVLAQTPQAFFLDDIYKAHSYCLENNIDLTDDASAFEACNMEVKVIDGLKENIKITYKNDVKQMNNTISQIKSDEFFKSQSERVYTKVHDLRPDSKKDEVSFKSGNWYNYNFKVGLGFDAHRFLDADQDSYIIIGGIKIRFHKKIDAHSDGDVVIHALVDAILGACGAGDIGQHFPPSDEKWRNADSSIFLLEAKKIMENKGGFLENIDITFIGEEPKIGKYRVEIQNNLASILDVDTNLVNIKATTTEKMGFTGRKEGVAAQAIVSIKFQQR